MSPLINPAGRCEKCAKNYIDRSSAAKEWCKHCQINSLKRNFMNWTSGSFAALYYSKRKDGSLQYHDIDSFETIALKCFYDKPNIINEFLNEIRENIVDEYLIYSKKESYKFYGISKNPDTHNYIMVFQYMNGENYKLRCKKCDEKYAERSYAKYEWYIPYQTNFLK
ncbi:hypothetical protein RirG_135980 [Rhizophagus irregularis DAOM 197198w]|uniref:Uncharacterized protein n=1 Tax=Rhizophagus irregularis (strain DAOM 197198w) TaxID=1432141 RepID=A0A015KYP2_RHIIW|nr:hypothetical protein RirG_135980 [Rhizophagus irregularis DAOM 197198w]